MLHALRSSHAHAQLHRPKVTVAVDVQAAENPPGPLLLVEGLPASATATMLELVCKQIPGLIEVCFWYFELAVWSKLLCACSPVSRMLVLWRCLCTGEFLASGLHGACPVMLQDTCKHSQCRASVEMRVCS